MKINPGGYFRMKLRGYILLQYLGKNEAVFRRICCREAVLTTEFCLRDHPQNAMIFNIDFKEFYGFDLQLDLHNLSVTRADYPNMITVNISDICVDNKSLVIRGSYRYYPITPAYHMYDHINFNMFIDLAPGSPDLRLNGSNMEGLPLGVIYQFTLWLKSFPVFEKVTSSYVLLE